MVRCLSLSFLLGFFVLLLSLLYLWFLFGCCCRKRPWPELQLLEPTAAGTGTAAVEDHYYFPFSSCSPHLPFTFWRGLSGPCLLFLSVPIIPFTALAPPSDLSDLRYFDLPLLPFPLPPLLAFPFPLSPHPEPKVRSCPPSRPTRPSPNPSLPLPPLYLLPELIPFLVP